MVAEKRQFTICRLAVWFIVAEVVFLPVTYFTVLNFLGPSTEYHEPTIRGAGSPAGGKYYAGVAE